MLGSGVPMLLTSIYVVCAMNNEFTGKPARATLVGFLDWKSTALIGYEIMMTENTQCIASALVNQYWLV